MATFLFDWLPLGKVSSNYFYLIHFLKFILMGYFKVLISDILRSFPRCVIYCPLHTVQGIETVELLQPLSVPLEMSRVFLRQISLIR